MEPSAKNFGPTTTWATLSLRAQMLGQLRAFFQARGLLEVETPLLSQDIVVDQHLDPLVVTLPPNPREPEQGPRYWLQTSPEFAMKRLLAAGAPAIYQICKAFRGAEIGMLHNPEFTMVEWYRLGDTLECAMQFTSDLAEHMLQRGPADRLTYRELFLRHTDMDPWRATDAELLATAQRWNISLPSPAPRDALLDLLLTHCLEPHLGCDRPTIVYHYPAQQAALAQVVIDADQQPVAERFELYVDGLELANGYHELLDADEHLRRSQANNSARAREGKPRLPDTGRFLAAMQHGLPPCSGAALGFDRLVMVATQAKSIRNVMPFPIDLA